MTSRLLEDLATGPRLVPTSGDDYQEVSALDLLLCADGKALDSPADWACD